MNRVSASLVVAALAVAAALYFGLRGDRTGSPQDVVPGVSHLDSPGRAAAPKGPDAGVFEQLLAAQRRDAPGTEGVAGTVLGPDGRPVSGAEVALLRLRTAWPEQRAERVAEVFTGADGSFRFATPRDVDLAIEVLATGAARERFEAPAALDRVTIRLTHGFEVSGVVRLGGIEQSGERGFRVLLEPGTGGTRRAMETFTDASSRFSFANVAAGPARLTVQFSPLAPTTVNSVIVGGEPVSISPQQQLGQTLVGRVVRASDQAAIAGAEVRVYPSAAWNLMLYEPYRTQTGEDGAFKVSGLGNGAVLLVVSHPECSTASRPVALGSAPPGQEIELGRRADVAVRFTGLIRPGMGLRLVSKDGEIHRARVGESGRAIFPDSVSTGPAKLELLDGVCAFAKTYGREVDVVLEEGSDNELDFELIEPSVITGRVLDDAGEPLADVLVSVLRHRFERRNPESWSVATDPDGRFALRGLPAIGVSLTFSLEGWSTASAPATITAPGERVDLGNVVLARPGTIEGHVFSAGAAVAGANLFATREGETASHAVSGPDGGYVLRGLAPGRYRVMGRSGSRPLQVNDVLVVVESGGTSSGVDLDIPIGRRISGLVVTRKGDGVAEAMVAVVGVTASVGSTDQTGRFDLEVPEGQVELQAFSPDFRSMATEVIAAGGTQVTIRLPWVSQGTIEATFLAGVRGHTPHRVIVGVAPAEDEADPESRGRDAETRHLRFKRSVAEVLPGGRLHVEQIPAGKAIAEIVAPGLGSWRGIIDVPPAGVVDLGEIRLEPGAELPGDVVDAGGRPVVGAIVHLGDPDDLRLDLARLNLTDRDGRFVLPGVTPDLRRLVVAAEGFSTEVRELVLPDDLLGVERFRVVLRPSSSIRVQLTKGGRAEPAFRVLAIRCDGKFLGTRVTDLDGRMTLVVDRPGRYEVFLFGESESSDAGVGIEMFAGSAPCELELAVD